VDNDKTREAGIESSILPKKKNKFPLLQGFTQNQIGSGGNIIPPETRRLLTKIDTSKLNLIVLDFHIFIRAFLVMSSHVMYWVHAMNWAATFDKPSPEFIQICLQTWIPFYQVKNVNLVLAIRTINGNNECINN